jgi:hypothetical protein
MKRLGRWLYARFTKRHALALKCLRLLFEAYRELFQEALQQRRARLRQAELRKALGIKS